jgi:hypothetical protein
VFAFPIGINLTAMDTSITLQITLQSAGNGYDQEKAVFFI